MLVKDTFTSDASNATQYTTPANLRGRHQFSYHYEWDGALTATVTLWMSNKPAPSLDSDDDWVQVTDVTLTDPAGSADKAADTVSNATALWYRFKVARSAGSSEVSFWVEHVASSTKV